MKDGLIIDGNADFVLEPFDEVNVRRSPMSEKINNVQVRGAVTFQGTYALQSKNVRLSDIVKQAGGFSKGAYIKGASLKRVLTKEELEQRELLKNLSDIEFYENMLEGNNSDNYTIMDSLRNLKIGEENVISVAIDMEKAMEEPGSHYDVVLRDGDIITIPEYTSTIKVQGEVKFPTTLSWRKGKSLKYYIKHAGGFGNKAKKNGVYVINMNGSVEQISRCSKKIEPGCEIVVPRKKERRSMTAGEIVTIGTSTASLATMIVTLINLLGE